MKVVGILTAYDLVVLGLFAVLIGRGLWLGMLKQVTGLLALYIAYFVASQHHDRLFPVLRDISTNPTVVFLASYVILFMATYVVVMLLGKMLGYVIQLTITSWFDKLLGGLVGFAKAVILVVLMHIVLGTILAPENEMLRSCATCKTLGGAADLTRELIRNEEVRKALMQKQPAIAIDTVKEYLAPGSGSDEQPKPPPAKP